MNAATITYLTNISRESTPAKPVDVWPLDGHPLSQASRAKAGNSLMQRIRHQFAIAFK